MPVNFSILINQFEYRVVYHLESWRVNAQVAVGSRSSVVRAPAAQAGGPGFDPQWLPCFFYSFSWLTDVKDLWCSSTVWLLSTQIP